MNPLTSERNFTPTLTAAPSLLSGSAVSVGAKMVHGQLSAAAGPTVTVTGDEAAPMLTLSSVARLRIVTLPCVDGVHLYIQFARPTAGCHVAPPSRDTSTAPTTPPPASLAVPVIVNCVPPGSTAPAVGNVTVEVGGGVSAEAD